MTPNYENSSITLWLQKLKEGNSGAAHNLWSKCFDELIAKASHYHRSRKQGIGSEEELASDAFYQLLKGVEEGRFGQLENTDDLWKLLTHFVSQKAIDNLRHEQREKRGSGKIRGESVFGDASEWGIQHQAKETFDPLQQVEFEDELNHLLGMLKREDLKKVVMLRLEGLTRRQIASSLSVSEASVTRKLRLIKNMWTEDQN